MVGVLLALASGLCDATGYSFNKYSSLGAQMTGTFRSAIMAAFTFCMALCKKEHLIPDNKTDITYLALAGICSL